MHSLNKTIRKKSKEFTVVWLVSDHRLCTSFLSTSFGDSNTGLSLLCLALSVLRKPNIFSLVLLVGVWGLASAKSASEGIPIVFALCIACVVFLWCLLFISTGGVVGVAGIDTVFRRGVGSHNDDRSEKGLFEKMVKEIIKITVLEMF